MRVIILPVIVVSLLIGFSACNNDTKAPATAEDSLNTQPLYPYPQYIKEQIAYVDTTPLAIEMQVFANGQRVDSNFIDRDKFAALAKAFAEPDLNLEVLRPQYDEKTFQDLTINTLTFSITAKDPDLPVQQVDILLNPQTKKVKNIIIKKQIKKDGSTEIQNLLWVHNMNFQVSKTISREDGTTVDSVFKVIWDRPIK